MISKLTIHDPRVDYIHSIIETDFANVWNSAPVTNHRLIIKFRDGLLIRASVESIELPEAE